MIWRFLSTPSAFPADPTGYALNQTGHVAIGIAGVWLIGFWVLPAYAAFEAWQWACHGAEAWDCVEDTAFVAAGVAAVIITPWAAGLAGLYLLSGWLRRRAEKGNGRSKCRAVRQK